MSKTKLLISPSELVLPNLPIWVNEIHHSSCSEQKSQNHFWLLSLTFHIQSGNTYPSLKYIQNQTSHLNPSHHHLMHELLNSLLRSLLISYLNILWNRKQHPHHSPYSLSCFVFLHSTITCKHTFVCLPQLNMNATMFVDIPKPLEECLTVVKQLHERRTRIILAGRNWTCGERVMKPKVLQIKERPPKFFHEGRGVHGIQDQTS